MLAPADARDWLQFIEGSKKLLIDNPRTLKRRIILGIPIKHQRAARKLIQYYRAWDMLPTIGQLASELRPPSLESRISASKSRVNKDRSPRRLHGDMYERKAEELYEHLERMGLVTAPGKYSGRPHLTAAGFAQMERWGKVGAET